MGAESLAQNTPNASKNFSPKCLPKPKFFFSLLYNILYLFIKFFQQNTFARAFPQLISDGIGSVSYLSWPDL